jgi:hypothetical protein
MSNETKQTAVEWYARRLFEIEIAYSQGVINTDVYIQSKIEAKQQAKEMEKERIETAFNSGYNNGGLDTCLTPKQYYEQTYGGGNK